MDGNLSSYWIIQTFYISSSFMFIGRLFRFMLYALSYIFVTYHNEQMDNIPIWKSTVWAA